LHYFENHASGKLDRASALVMSLEGLYSRSCHYVMAREGPNAGEGDSKDWSGTVRRKYLECNGLWSV